MTRVAVLALALALAGCGGPPPNVPLVATWPTATQDYDDLVEAWTRHGELHRDYQQVVAIDATFKSPAWRDAYARRQAAARGLDAAATDALVADAKAAADKSYDIEVIVTTWDRRENALHRPDPVWKLTLIDGHGRSLQPTSITRDKRPKHILRAEFPAVGDFAEAYVASFAVDPAQPVLGPDARTVRLRLASERGAVEVRWDAR